METNALRGTTAESQLSHTSFILTSAAQQLETSPKTRAEHCVQLSHQLFPPPAENHILFPPFCMCDEASVWKRGVFSVSEEMSQLWQPFMILSLKSETKKKKKQSYDAAVVGSIPSHAQCQLSLPLYMNLEALKDSLLLVGVRTCYSTGKLRIRIFLTGA